MNDPSPTVPRSEHAGESPLMTLVSAAMFLFVGFMLGLRGASDSPVYNGSVTLLVWMARAVGIGLLIEAALIHFRAAAAGVVGLLLSCVATVGCLGIGAVWLAHGDMSGVLLLLFGVLNFGAARSAWKAVGRSTPE